MSEKEAHYKEWEKQFTDGLYLNEEEKNFAIKTSVIKLKEIREIVKKIYEIVKNTNIYTDNLKNLKLKIKKLTDLLEELKLCNIEFHDILLKEIKKYPFFKEMLANNIKK